VSDDPTDKLVIRAIISYCGYHFELIHGTLDRADAFKRSYDEQKAQLGMATNYTTW
jgi:poly-beta-hydroxyalkanoate depolymerase